MRPSLTLITATVALVACVSNASPISAGNNAEVAAPLAERAPAVNNAEIADVEARSRKHHKNKAKHHHHKKGGNGKATFYTGDQLDAPACGGSTPSDNDMIAAVKQGSQFKCHDWVTLKKDGKSATVKIVDYCAGCDDTHFDLSKAAFKSLAPLDKGIISGLEWNMA